MEHDNEQPISRRDDVVPLHGHDDPDEPTLPRGRVAVVEDGEATRHFLVQVLRGQGYQVKGIEDGASALPLLRLHLPEIILLDVSLPGLSGFEVCRLIRGDPLLRHATVIMLTGRAGGEDRAEGWRAGADDYLIKPCDIPELLARVAAHMRHREAPQRQWLNPITRLPAPAALEDDLLARLRRNEAFDLCYADIAYFKSYNHRYGYLAGDVLLVTMADLLREVAADIAASSPHASLSPTRLLAERDQPAGQEHGNAAALAGHLGGDDFIIITPLGRALEAGTLLMQRFSVLVPSLYHGMDRERGWVPVMDQRGGAQQFPLVHLALATLSCHPSDFPLDAQGYPAANVVAQCWERLRAATHPLHGMEKTG